MAFDSPVSLKIYRNFKAIEPTEWLRVVRYYERHEAAIRSLDFDEHFDCLKTYTEALFHSGQSAKHLVMSDVLIGEIFEKNVRAWHGEDVFAQTLFQKAASHYNLDELARSEHVLRELLKIRPNYPLADALLFRVFRAKKAVYLKKTRAVALVFFLAAVPVIAFQLFVVRNFHPELNSVFTKIWCGFLALGWVALIVGDGWVYWSAWRQVRQFVDESRLKKRSL